MRVLKNIIIIVVGEESVVVHTLERNDGDYREDEADGGDLPRLVGSGSNVVSGLSGPWLRRAVSSCFAQSRFTCHNSNNSDHSDFNYLTIFIWQSSFELVPG